MNGVIRLTRARTMSWGKFAPSGSPVSSWFLRACSYCGVCFRLIECFSHSCFVCFRYAPKSDAFPAAEKMFGDHVLYYQQPGDALRAAKV